MKEVIPILILIPVSCGSLYWGYKNYRYFKIEQSNPDLDKLERNWAGLNITRSICMMAIGAFSLLVILIRFIFRLL